MAPIEDSELGEPSSASVSEELHGVYASRELVAFVGAGVSVAAGLPSRRELVSGLLATARDFGLYPAQIEEIEEIVGEGELLEALSELERALTPSAFTRTVRRALDDSGRDPPPLARALAELGWLRGVLTTNLDRLLERAFEGRWPCSARPLADFIQGRGWLLKLHGTLGERDTWVLTSEEYRRAIHRDPLHQALARALFLATPLLFVGCAFDDPDFVAVVEQVSALAEGQPPNHFALFEESELDDARRRRLGAVGIRAIAYPNPDGDHAECVRILRALAPATPSSRA